MWLSVSCCKEFSWKVFNHPRYSQDLAPSDFHLFLHLKKFLFSQRFQNGREEEMSVTQWFQSQVADFYEPVYKSWYHGKTNVSIPEVNKFKIAQHLLYLFQ